MTDYSQFINPTKEEGESNPYVALVSAQGINPDSEAQTQSIARQYRIPVDTARVDKENLQLKQTFNAFKATQPIDKTNAFISDPKNAALVHDDLANLSGIGKAAQAIGSGFNAFNSGFYGGLESGASLVGLKDAQNYFGGLRRQQDYKAQSAINADSFVGQSVLSGLQSTGAFIPALAAGIITKNPTASLALMSGQTYGQSAGNYLDVGLSPSRAAIAATADAAVEFVTEKMPVLNLFKGLDLPIAKQLIQQAAREIPGELAATTLQNINAYYAVNPNAYFDDFYNSLPTDGDLAQTVIATLTSVGATTGVARSAQKISQVLQSKQGVQDNAQQTTENLDALHDVASQSKLKERDAERLASHIQDITESESPQTQVFINGKEAQTLYQSFNDADKEAIAASYPEFTKQMEDSALHGGDIVLDHSEYAGKMSINPAMKAFNQHVRSSVDGLSNFQIQDDGATQAWIDEQLSEISSRIGTQGNPELSTQQSLERTFKDMLMNAGHTPDVAQQQATLFGQSFNAFSENYAGNDAALQDIIKQRFGDLFVNSQAKQELRQMGDALDLRIDEARNYYKQKGSRSTQKSNETPTTGLFGAIARKVRAPVTPTPIASYIERVGGVDKNSPVSLEIKAILDKRANRVLRKNGKINRFDAIPVVEWNQEFKDYPNLQYVEQEGDNGYVAQQWLLDQLKDESMGGGALTQKQVDREATINTYSELNRLVYEITGKDIMEATNYEVRQAIEEYQSQDHSLYQSPQSRTPHTDKTIIVDNKERSAINSNGKLIANTKEELENFWRWFGDSKVVDSDGKPLVVYHGTNADIESFDLQKIGLNGLALGAGFYFVDAKLVAEGYGKNILPVYLKSENPSINAEKKTITKKQIKNIIADLEKEDEYFLSNYGDIKYEGYNNVLAMALKDFYDASKNDIDIIGSIINVGGIDREIVMQSIIKNTNKDGVIANADIASNSANKEDTIYVVLTPNQIKSATRNSGEFSASNNSILNQSNFGSITFTPDGKSIIDLFAGRNLSTVLHEMGHFYVSVLRELAVHPNATEQVQNDWAVFKDFVGSKDGIFTVEQEEKLARGFEAYLFEGKSPSVELDSAFNRFKSWMLSIYKKIENLGVRLNKDVRGVFDRMVATKEQIETVKAYQWVRADPAILEMLNKQQKTDYIKKVENAERAAEDKLLRKALREMKQQGTEEYKKNLAEVTQEQKDILSTMPLEKAINFLQTGKFIDGTDAPFASFKLSKEQIINKYGKEIIKYLPSNITAKDGADIEVAAETLGFINARVMIDAMRGHKGINKTLADMIEKAMLQRYGDMLKDGTLERSAIEEMATNVSRADRLAYELKAISDAAEEKTIPLFMLQGEARRIISETKISSLSPYTYYRAEVRASKEAGGYLQSKEYKKAADAKRRQILNYYLYKEALAQQKKINARLRFFRGLNKNDKDLAKTIDIDYVNAARSVLQAFNLSNTKIDVNKWLETLQQEDKDTYDNLVPFILAHQATANTLVAQKGKGVKYNQLSVETFIALSDAIENVLNAGRQLRNIEIDGVKRDIDDIRNELSATLADKKVRKIAGENSNPTNLDKFTSSLLGTVAKSKRIESWIDVQDNGKADGVWRKYVWNPINDAVASYRNDREQKVSELLNIITPHRDRLNQSEAVYAKELNYNFRNKAELLGMVQHLGNPSNIQKLLNGYGWQASQMEAFMQRSFDEGIITKDDMDLVQGIWGFYESLKPQAQKAYKKMFGFRFKELTIIPLQTPFGEYAGGYVPARGNPITSAQAAQQADKQAANDFDNAQFMFPSPIKGWAENRTNATYKMEMNLNLVVSHLDDVLKFIHIAHPARNVGRIFANRDFRDLMFEYDAHIIDKGIMPWLQRTVRQRTSLPNDHNALARVADIARKNTTAQLIMLSPVNTLQQITGLNIAMARLGGRTVLKSAYRYMVNPIEQANAVREKSELIRHYHNIYADDAESAVRDILNPDRKWYNKTSEWTAKHGYILQTTMQGMVNTIVWQSAYDAAASGKAGDFNAVPNEVDLVRYADSIVRMSQGSQAASDISAIEVQDSFVKLFTQFYGYFNAQANYIYSAVKNNPKNIGLIYFYTILLPSVVANLIAAGLRGRLPDDDDEDGSSIDNWFLDMLIIPQMKYIAAFVPFGGTILNPIIGKLTPSPFDDQMQFGASFSVAGQAIQTLTGSIPDSDGRAVQQVGTAIGMITGLPIGQPAKAVGYFVDDKDKIKSPF